MLAGCVWQDAAVCWAGLCSVPQRQTRWLPPPPKAWPAARQAVDERCCRAGSFLKTVWGCCQALPPCTMAHARLVIEHVTHAAWTWACTHP